MSERGYQRGQQRGYLKGLRTALAAVRGARRNMPRGCRESHAIALAEEEIEKQIEAFTKASCRIDV